MEEKNIRETLENSSAFFIESEPEHHFNTVIKTVRILQEQGFTGVYMSFQRPLESLEKTFMRENLDIEDINVIDFATELEDMREDEEKTVFMPPDTETVKINRTLFRKIRGLEGDKKFLLLDSLDTPILYRPPEEVLKISEFILMLREFEPGIRIIFNTSKNTSENRFLKDILRKMDRVVE